MSWKLPPSEEHLRLLFYGIFFLFFSNHQLNSTFWVIFFFKDFWHIVHFWRGQTGFSSLYYHYQWLKILKSTSKLSIFTFFNNQNTILIFFHLQLCLHQASPTSFVFSTRWPGISLSCTVSMLYCTVFSTGYYTVTACNHLSPTGPIYAMAYRRQGLPSGLNYTRAHHTAVSRPN